MGHCSHIDKFFLTGELMLTYIICGVVAVVLVIAAYFVYSYQKRKLRKPVNKVEQKEQVIEKIQLTAVERLAGSSPLCHKETDEEVRARLLKLSRDEFLLLNVDEKPFSLEEWDSLKTYEEAEARSMHEIGMLYAYNHDGTVNQHRADLLYREFITYK